MNLRLKALATAVAFAGALGITAAQASANFNVDFAVHNADSSISMIRTSALPGTVTGLDNPPQAVLPGGSDPGSGHALWSDQLPTTLNASKQISLIYANALSQSLDQCTFTMTVKNVGGTQPYELDFAASGGTCSVPASVRTSDGQFTAQTYILSYKS